jgi:hypothetical protein
VLRAISSGRCNVICVGLVSAPAIPFSFFGWLETFTYDTRENIEKSPAPSHLGCVGGITF